MVIFGFGPGKQEDLGEVAPSVCPNCHNQVFFHHVDRHHSHASRSHLLGQVLESLLGRDGQQLRDAGVEQEAADRFGLV